MNKKIILNVVANLLEDFMEDDRHIMQCMEVAQSICMETTSLSLQRIINREKEKQRLEKKIFFYEKTIPKLSSDDFRQQFGMSRGSVEKLLTLLPTIGCTTAKISKEKKLLLTIWSLSHSDTFASVGDKFDLSLSSTYKYFYETIQAIHSIFEQYIKLPNAEKREEIAAHFYMKSKVPMIVGAIGYCHIRILQPQNNGTDYYRLRKQYYSIILQAICDHKMRFIDICTGNPGGMLSETIFSSSPIYELLNDSSNPLLSSDEHIAGSEAYPNSNYLITSFRDNGHLSHAQRRFNDGLGKVRRVIRCAFGRLKCKFPKLEMLNVQSVEHANDIITACCILHNFTINENLRDEIDENCDDYYKQQEGEDDPDEEANENNRLFNEVIDTEKRMSLVNSLRN